VNAVSSHDQNEHNQKFACRAWKRIAGTAKQGPKKAKGALNGGAGITCLQSEQVAEKTNGLWALTMPAASQSQLIDFLLK
jgi:hypothetical protein